VNTPSAVQRHLHAIHLSGGKLEPGGRAALSALSDTFAGDPRRDTLVVHFHGGLNTRADGLVRVDDLAPAVPRPAAATCWW
jgi:hypothetical protein